MKSEEREVSAKSPRGFELKLGNGHFEGRGLSHGSVGLNDIRSAHGADFTFEVASAVVFKYPTRQNFGLHANHTIPHHFSSLANGVDDVPFPFQNLDALVASVFDDDPIRKDKTPVLRPGKLFLKAAPNMDPDSLGCGAVDFRTAHASIYQKVRQKPNNSRLIAIQSLEANDAICAV